jgi:hypothetical protein
MDCIWPHHITKLYGVPVTPVECLPKRCSCGAQLIYADPVIFISRPVIHYESDSVSVEELDVKFEPVKVKP